MYLSLVLISVVLWCSVVVIGLLIDVLKLFVVFSVVSVLYICLFVLNSVVDIVLMFFRFVLWMLVRLVVWILCCNLLIGLCWLSWVCNLVGVDVSFFFVSFCM